MKIVSLNWNFRTAWVFALLFNGISGFLLFLALCGLIHSKPTDLPVLLFVAIGLAFLVWAIRQTVLRNLYGETFFFSDAEIVPWRGRLHGRISFSRATPTLMGRHFHLSLFYQVYDVPGQPLQFETPWRDSHSVDIAPDGTIPVFFSLPAEVKRKFIIRADRTEWKLKVKEVGGGFQSFAAEYVLPAEEEPEKDPFEDES